MGIIPTRGALQHYSRHGSLPDTPFWNRVETLQDRHPARFDRIHPELAGTFDDAQTVGLMPETAYWDKLRGRYELNEARFQHYHPFLGRLIERDTQIRKDLEQVVNTPIVPLHRGPDGGAGEAGFFPTVTGGGDGGTTIIGGETAIVPEPSTMVLGSLGLISALVIAWARKRGERGRMARGASL